MPMARQPDAASSRAASPVPPAGIHRGGSFIVPGQVSTAWEGQHAAMPNASPGSGVVVDQSEAAAGWRGLLTGLTDSREPSA
jgi:hypothetical protein